MSTITRYKRSSRISIGPYKRHELLTGACFYPALGYNGYGNGTDTDVARFISDEMRNDWEANRTELLRFWRSGKDTTFDVFPDSKPWLFERGTPGTLPWAAEQFDREAAK